MSYNGWTNRETWLVNSWFKLDCKEDVDIAQQIIEEDVSLLSGYLKDLVADHKINWAELHSHFEENDEPSNENENYQTKTNEETENE